MIEQGNKIEQLERKIDELQKQVDELSNQRSFPEQIKESMTNFAGRIKVVSGNIFSGDYKEGESGWSLGSGGDLEANNGVFRGRLEAEEGYFKGDVEGATFIGTNFEGINVNASNITGTNIEGGTITASEIEGGTISGTDISAVNLSGSNINGSTITGGTIRTSTGDTSVVLSGGDNNLTVYKDGEPRIVMGEGTLTFLTPSGIGAGEIVGLGTQNLAFNTSGIADYIMTPSYFYSTDQQDLGAIGERFGTIYLVNSPNVSSSIKLKEDITKTGYGLDTLLKMNPVKYTKKGNKELGFIAEELKEIVPEVSDGESYKPTELIPILVESIKELYNIIKTQQSNNK